MCRRRLVDLLCDVFWIIPVLLGCYFLLIVYQLVLDLYSPEASSWSIVFDGIFLLFLGGLIPFFVWEWMKGPKRREEERWKAFMVNYNKKALEQAEHEKYLERMYEEREREWKKLRERYPQ